VRTHARAEPRMRTAASCVLRSAMDRCVDCVVHGTA
jgi:hypothetical protein